MSCGEGQQVVRDQAIMKVEREAVKLEEEAIMIEDVWLG